MTDEQREAYHVARVAAMREYDELQPLVQRAMSLKMVVVSTSDLLGLAVDDKYAFVSRTNKPSRVSKWVK